MEEDTQELRVDHPRNVLYQVAKAMNGQHDDLSVTLPAQSTWQTAIQASLAAMGTVDESIYLMPASAGSTTRRGLRDLALDTARDDDKPIVGPSRINPGRPIRTSIDIQNSTPPKPASEKTRQHLREMAKKWTDEPWKDPYVTLRAGLADSFLPVVSANLRMQAIDDFPAGESGQITAVGMIWDTGAHRTVITEELVPESFRRYLQTEIHDPYRPSDGSCVQVDIEIALTNRLVLVNTLAVIVPQRKMPNQLRGILFGQLSCINRIRYESVPREFLVAKGEYIGDDLWGDFIVKEYFDEDGIARTV